MIRNRESVSRAVAPVVSIYVLLLWYFMLVLCCTAAQRCYAFKDYVVRVL